MCRVFTKRQRSILDLILRLSWGCNKKAAIIPRQKDFELVGIDETKVKTELKWLINAKVIKWDKNKNEFSFIKDYDQWRVSIVPKYERERLSTLIHINIESCQNSNLPKQQEIDEKARGNLTKKQVFEPDNPSETKTDGIPIESIIESKDSQKSKTKIFDADSIQYKLADLLRKGILKNLPKAKVPDDKGLNKWAAIIDKIMRLDKRTSDEIAEIITFSIKDQFWSDNILSADSLRKQFDRLTAQMNRSKKQVIRDIPRQAGTEGVYQF